MDVTMADKPKSLTEFIDRTIADTLARCTSCARCYDVCPMPQYSTALDGADAKTVVGGVLGLLRGEPTNPQCLEWVRICVMSTSCIPACPEGVNPMLMLRVARMAALGSLGGEKQLNGREEPHFFRKIDAFAALQLDDRELNEWHDRRLP
jgi:L-lactate utilization protein LutB